VKKDRIKYCVAGAGGTGGCLAAFLALAGCDVTLIARGDHLAAMKKDGLVLVRDDGENRTETVAEGLKTVSWDEYAASGSVPDVLFLCTKSYSVESAAEDINRCCGDDTLIIPLLNGIRMGDFVRRYVSCGRVIDGCIYIVGMKDGPGRVLMRGDMFRIVFGSADGSLGEDEAAAIADDLRGAGIKTVVSDNIIRDCIRKFSYVATTGAAGLYFGTNVGPMQHPGEERDFVIGLIREVAELGEAMGAHANVDLVKKGLAILDHVPPDSCSSMQRDVEAGRQSEFAQQVTETVALGEKYGVDMKYFRLVDEKVGPRVRGNK
jgi:2-dehydropantoate 2-reductase